MIDFSKYPSGKELIKKYPIIESEKLLKVNNHIHSPYSYSSFASIQEAVEMADKENVRVLGINDFFVPDGYEEFSEYCEKCNVFPLFNIEFMGLIKEYQTRGIRINDINNPGRIYISGKGLNASQIKKFEGSAIIITAKKESQRQISEMINKLNKLFESAGSSIRFSEELIRSKYARDIIRERHLAKALRIEAENTYSSDKKFIDFFTRLYNGKIPETSPDNPSAFEEEIRNRLLKAGGPAFVTEDEKAFPPVNEINTFILEAGGIPTYPILLDIIKENYTEFETSKEQLLKVLKENGFYSVEFLAVRNSYEALHDYSTFIYENGFIVTFGTEHNTPDMIPLTVTCKDNIPLGNELLDISYRGACVIAAHQYLVARGEKGYVTENGIVQNQKRTDFEILGNAIIRDYLNEQF